MKRTLEPAAFWKLRALLADTQRAAAVALSARETLLIAQQRQSAYLTEIGLDPKAASWEVDDEACTVTVPDPSP